MERNDAIRDCHRRGPGKDRAARSEIADAEERQTIHERGDVTARDGDAFAIGHELRDLLSMPDDPRTIREIPLGAEGAMESETVIEMPFVERTDRIDRRVRSPAQGSIRVRASGG